MKKDKTNLIDNKRRSLLKTFAASGISKSLISSSPLVAGMLIARDAQSAACTTNCPNKSVIIYVPGGCIPNNWTPSGSGSGMSLGSMSAGYEPVKTECNFLSGMTHSHGGHGNMPMILSSNWTEDSYDVQMGKALSIGMPFEFLNLGVHSNGHGYITRNNGSSVPFQDNPFTAFTLAFGNGGGGGGGGNPKTNIMDAHAEAANAIRGKLAGYEVERLDSHLQAIADTRDRLANVGGGGGSCASAPNNTEFPLTYDTFGQQARLQADIAVAALKCGITASVSLGLGNHQGEFRIPEASYTGNYHQSIHGGSNGLPGYPYYVEMRNELAKMSAYLINRLRQEGILDETVVVETTDMGHADLHSAENVPFMIAGGGSAVRRGQVTNASGRNQHDVLATAAAACGVNVTMGQEISGVLTS